MKGNKKFHTTPIQSQHESSRFYMQQFWWCHQFSLLPHLMPMFLTFGKSRIWFASSSNSSKLREYRIMSSGTLGSEQWRLSTNSTWRLQPLKIGMHLNIVDLWLSKTTRLCNFHTLVTGRLLFTLSFTAVLNFESRSKTLICSLITSTFCLFSQTCLRFSRTLIRSISIYTDKTIDSISHGQHPEFFLFSRASLYLTIRMKHWKKKKT